MIHDDQAIESVYEELKNEDKDKDEILHQVAHEIAESCGVDTVCDCNIKKKMKIDNEFDDKKQGKEKSNDSLKDIQEIKSPEYFSDEIEEGEIVDSMEI